MNHDDNNSGQESDSHDNEPEIQIPELTQQIPVVDQAIPELTVRADEANEESGEVAETDIKIPELTDVYQGAEESEEVVIDGYPVMASQIGDQELELQQWQIEQQAKLQVHEWHQVADMQSIHEQSAVEAPNSEETKQDVILSEEQQALVEASWQHLESLIMEQMPIEIAGIYLTLLEQQIDANRAQIAEAVQLLEAETLDNVLDYFKIERGF